MKYSSNAIPAILFTITLLTGCASSGTTAIGSTETSTSESNTGTTTASAASENNKKATPAAEPECE